MSCTYKPERKCVAAEERRGGVAFKRQRVV